MGKTLGKQSPPMQTIVLKPPLREAWSFDQGFTPLEPVVGHGLVFFKNAKSTTVALDEAYRRDGLDLSAAACGGDARGPRRNRPRRCARRRRPGPGDPGCPHRSSAQPHRCAARVEEHRDSRNRLVQGGFNELRSIDLGTGREGCWQQSFGPDTRNWMAGTFGVTEEHVAYGLKDGLSLAWRRRLAGRSGERASAI